MKRDAASKLKRCTRSTTVLKLVCSLVGSVLLATAHAQTNSAREQALQERLRQLIFNQGDFSEAKRIANQVRNTELGTTAQEETQRLFWITDICHAAGSAEIPKRDIPSASEINRYKVPSLECVDYREGLGVIQDYQAYRKCLLSKPHTDTFSLAEIYANGRGVAHNRKLAMALICHGDAPEFALEGMLQALESGGEFSGRCAYDTSRLSMLQCASETNYIDKKRNTIELEKLVATWSMQDRAALKRVMETSKAFSTSRAENELDTSGSIGMAESVYAQDSEWHSVISGLKFFENEEYPPTGDAAAADRELNLLYREILQGLRGTTNGSITLEGVRKTQRLWLIYRDEFIRFALARYPRTKQEQWLAWLTKKRLEQLRELQQEI
jgi:hypothetical protein